MKDIIALKLLSDMELTYTSMLAVAEEAFFAGNEEKVAHFDICIRQWFNAIKMVREAILQSKGG